MMRFLNGRKKMKHRYEEIMEGMIRVDWVSDGDSFVYPILLRTINATYELQNVNDIPYYCKLNNYGYEK